MEDNFQNKLYSPANIIQKINRRILSSEILSGTNKAVKNLTRIEMIISINCCLFSMFDNDQSSDFEK